MPKLKVFRTTIGFHDAFVAAPSRAAALRAWGATTDLFAMDAADQMTDEKMMAEPLAKPGEVIRRSRGSEAEHLIAAGPTDAPKAQTAAVAKPKPRPSRSKLDKAEKRLEIAEAEHATERQHFEAKIAAIQKQDDAARRAFEARRAKLDAIRETEADAYEQGMARWQER